MTVGGRQSMAGLVLYCKLNFVWTTLNFFKYPMVQLLGIHMDVQGVIGKLIFLVNAIEVDTSDSLGLLVRNLVYLIFDPSKP